MDDEHAVTLALLHGCGFFSYTENLWYVNDAEAIHPVERRHSEETSQYGWATREELAHDYCKFYKLGAYSAK